MKTEPKPFASLSSGLLARKGAARPAMRPQGFGGQVGGGLEDLGWDDMGFEPPKPAEADRDTEHDAFGEELAPHPLRNPLAALTPVNSPVHDQQAEIADRLEVADEAQDETIDEDYDETAELVEGDELPEIVLNTQAEPEFEPAPEPVAIAPVGCASRGCASRGRPAAPAAHRPVRAGFERQSGIHAPPGCEPSLEVAFGLRGERSFCPATGDRRGRPPVGGNAGAGLDG
jgi:hypothetical protein